MNLIRSLIPGIGALLVVLGLQAVEASGAEIMVGAIFTFIALRLLDPILRFRRRR